MELHSQVTKKRPFGWSQRWVNPKKNMVSGGCLISTEWFIFLDLPLFHLFLGTFRSFSINMIDKSDKKLMASSDRVSATFREKLLRIGKGQHTPHRMLQKTATGMPAGILRTTGRLSEGFIVRISGFPHFHHQLAFGNDSHSYWTWPICRFTYQKWWFSIG